MCGIAGIAHLKKDIPIRPEVLGRMTDSVSHRGPDGRGTYIDPTGRVGLGHRRLSIIDLETGSQPMSDVEGRAWIVFNGEIYNYRELRAELVQRGCRFRTNSDTEVILQCYLTFGTSGFDRLNGIFALAIFDVTERRLVLARDHFGVKPLYLARTGAGVAFGSEMKSLFHVEGIDRSVDREALRTFLALRYNPSPLTLLKGIQKLAPGSWVECDAKGGERSGSFWGPAEFSIRRIGFGEASEEYARLLGVAVRRQMVSDVPVGLLLSGGIDSYAIGHLMRQYAGDTVRSFTVGFEGQSRHDERSDAAKSAALLGTEHREIVIDERAYLDGLCRSAWHTEEPVAHDSIPAMFAVSALAGEHLKVVLAGQGADEVLAGYKRYYAVRHRASLGWSFVLPWADRVLGLVIGRDAAARAQTAFRLKDELGRFISIFSITTPEERERLLGAGATALEPALRIGLIGEFHARSAGLPDELARMLYVDARTSLSDDLLLFNDKLAMAHGLEMRVPFLDRELVTFLERLPSSMKIRLLTRKAIHKRALERWVPREVVHRPKRGFVTPFRDWMKGDFGRRSYDLMSADDGFVRQHLDLREVKELFRTYRESQQENHWILSALSMLELWGRSFYRGLPLKSAEGLFY